MQPNYQNNFNNNMNNNQNQNTNYSRTSSLVLNLNANPYQSSKPRKKIHQIVPPQNPIFNNQLNRIKEVYADNFTQEIKNISNLLAQYPYVGMDTEFPGVIYPCPVATFDYYYQFTKVNVDKLKLLYNSGIDFKLLKSKGIPHSLFAEYMTTSGLVLNEKITWICFNGSSDFAYLLKYLINDNLPEDEKEFIELKKLYFPNIYDVKYLVNDSEIYKGGLNKLAKELEVERSGEIHQAGSDSQVTSDVFFRLVRNNIISQNDLNEGKNVIYGIGEGNNMTETFNYTQFKKGLDVSFLYQSIENNILSYKNNSNNNNNKNMNNMNINNNMNMMNNNMDNNMMNDFNEMINNNMDINYQSAQNIFNNLN